MKKILFINHEISPFVAESELAEMGRRIPQMAQENGFEIRTFMPKWGNINERRGQLHEVQRLSGMNIIINDTDHPLIIKVASLPQSKVQVYFIDNDEYFFKRQKDNEPANDSADNGQRAIFFARGVIETIKKLRWSPDIIHCQGWMSAFVPLYIKKAYNDEPCVSNAKVITSLFECNETGSLGNNIKNEAAFKEVTVESLSDYNDEFSYSELAKLAINNSDGIIAASEKVDAEFIAMAEKSDAKFMPYSAEPSAEEYTNFYNSLFEE